MFIRLLGEIFSNNVNMLLGKLQFTIKLLIFVHKAMKFCFKIKISFVFLKPDLVSAQRSLVSKCEVTELSDQLSGRGDSLMLCLFTDNIEVCKKRSRGFNNAKSPSTTMNGLNVTTKVKSYKHIKLISLSSIRYVVDIRDSPRAFALSCRLSKENKDKEYYFSINEEEVDKTMYLRSLCKQLAENSCRADADQFLASVDSTELSIDISDLNIGTLSKAFKFATRTRLKVKIFFLLIYFDRKIASG